MPNNNEWVFGQMPDNPLQVPNNNFDVKMHERRVKEALEHMRKERERVQKEVLIKDYYEHRKPTATRPCDLFPSKQKVGIELELENLNGRLLRDMPRFKHWDVTGDGSLRNNGYEFVSNMPRNGGVLLKSINELFKTDVVKNADPSWRCGTHVHMDVRMWTWEQVKIFMVIYLTEEFKLFNHMDSKERMHSNFCIPINWCHELLRRLFSENMDSVVRNWNKYTAMNLAPVRNQGSIEWRGSHATIEEKDIILLVDHLYSISERALKFETVEEAIESIKDSHPNTYEMCKFYNTKH